MPRVPYMFPLKSDQPYPYEHWWFAAFADEIERDLVGRTILGQRMLLYRTEAGEAIAVSGLCPHRSFPLDEGRLVGDTIQCGYHGFRFDQSGACVFVPNQDAVPGNSNLQSFPVHEQGGLIWVWTGEPANADPALLPDLHGMGIGNDAWKSDRQMPVTISCRYTLLVDNLMDLSHISFVHEGTIPGGEFVASIKPELIESDDSINAERVGRSMPPNPLFKMQFPDHDGPVDAHFDAEFFSPAFIRTAGAHHASESGAPLGSQHYLHLITPETPNSVHYTVIATRDFGLDNVVLSEMAIKMGDQIQSEDSAVLESIERVIAKQSGPIREISARADQAAIRVRNRIDRMVAAEAGS